MVRCIITHYNSITFNRQTFLSLLYIISVLIIDRHCISHARHFCCSKRVLFSSCFLLPSSSTFTSRHLLKGCRSEHPAVFAQARVNKRSLFRTLVFVSIQLRWCYASTTKTLTFCTVSFFFCGKRRKGLRCAWSCRHAKGSFNARKGILATNPQEDK